MTQLKEKLSAYKQQPKKGKRLVSLFVSPKGERIAVCVGNHLTILWKDDDYQNPYGTFSSKNDLLYNLLIDNLILIVVALIC